MLGRATRALSGGGHALCCFALTYSSASRVWQDELMAELREIRTMLSGGSRFAGISPTASCSCVEVPTTLAPRTGRSPQRRRRPSVVPTGLPTRAAIAWRRMSVTANLRADQQEASVTQNPSSGSWRGSWISCIRQPIDASADEACALSNLQSSLPESHRPSALQASKKELVSSQAYQSESMPDQADAVAATLAPVSVQTIIPASTSWRLLQTSNCSPNPNTSAVLCSINDEQGSRMHKAISCELVSGQDSNKELLSRQATDWNTVLAATLGSATPATITANSSGLCGPNSYTASVLCIGDNNEVHGRSSQLLQPKDWMAESFDIGLVSGNSQGALNLSQKVNSEPLPAGLAGQCAKTSHPEEELPLLGKDCDVPPTAESSISSVFKQSSVWI